MVTYLKTEHGVLVPDTSALAPLLNALVRRAILVPSLQEMPFVVLPSIHKSPNETLCVHAEPITTHPPDFMMLTKLSLSVCSKSGPWGCIAQLSLFLLFIIVGRKPTVYHLC
jgi:hypothetical protein